MSGKTVLVTGGARRIGRAVVESLARSGWRVVVHCHRARRDADQLAGDLTREGAEVAVVGADLGDAAAAATLVDQAVAAAGPLSAVVNNAARFSLDTLDDVTADGLKAHLDVNLIAPVLIARAFSRQLPAGTQGCIVNMLDNKVASLNPDYFSYTLGKVGLAGATEMLAMALAPHIRVCGVAPGITLLSGTQSSENFDAARRLTLTGRPNRLDDVVAAVRFVLETPSLNGTVLTVDGGQVAMKLARDPAFLVTGGPSS